MTEVVRVRLRPGRERSVRQGHPWLFSGAIDQVDGPADAPLAQVFAASGEPLATGFWNPRSELRARLVAAGTVAVDRALFAARITAAVAHRARLVPADTTGYRLLNAEGDGVPGWTVDRFGGTLVSQVTAAGLEALRAEAYAALAEAFPGHAILQRNALPARRSEGLRERGDEAIRGQPPAEASFTELGLRFAADLAAGQKTGFYFDQRENRVLAAGLATGRTLLDLFAHTGAFAAHALRGGAARVVAVESSARLAERARRHLRDNALDEAALEWVAADVFEVLRERHDSFDVVVCDPPPLVRRRADLDRGARAYKDLNRLALGRVAPGGLLLTFSCSGGVDAKLFRQILFAAAREAGVQVQLLRPLAAAADHPVAITHPEGEYLKGWLARVGPQIL
jgi:23S rRNA (cytosine1962-C5)-methyltransferase